MMLHTDMPTITHFASSLLILGPGIFIFAELIGAEWRIYASVNLPSLIQIMACRRQAIVWINAGILLIRPLATNFSEISIEIHFHSRKSIWKYSLENGGHFVSASMC